MSKTNTALGALLNGGIAPGFTVSSMGAGRRRHHHHGSGSKTHRHHHGTGLVDIIKKGHELLKKHKVLSKLGKMAEEKGYGRRRKRTSVSKSMTGGKRRTKRVSVSKSMMAGRRRHRRRA
jgi:hypothetical protein